MLLAYVSASYGFAFSAMVAFLIPLRAHELGAPIGVIGLIVGAGAALPALLSVPSGELSDRLGPRKTYILSTLVSGITCLVGAYTESYWILFCAQLVTGMGRSTAWLASQTYLSNVGRDDERARIAGRMSFATNGGMILAPLVIATSTDLFGLRLSFVTLTVLSLAYTLIALRLPEVRVEKTTSRRGGSVGFGLALRLIRLPGIRLVLLSTFARLWNIMFWMAFYALLLVQKGVAPTAIGTILAVYAVISTVVTLSAGRLAAWMGNVPALVGCLTVGSFGVILSPYLLTYPLIFLPAILLGIGQGLSLPLLISTVGDEAPPDQRGVALGLRMAVSQGASSSAPVIAGGVAATLGMDLSFIFNGVLAWFLLGVGLWLYHATPQPKPVALDEQT